MTSAAPVLVSAHWLQEHLGSPGLVILDASWYLPADGRDCRAEFANAHIPGALFFAIEELVDRDSDLPHMLPPAGEFTSAMRSLGVNAGDRVVVYDTSGVFSAPRAWWMFRIFGHRNISVLDGGLPAWRRAGGRLVATADEHGSERRAGDFTASAPDQTLLRSMAQVRDAIGDGDSQVLDARSAPRFRGEVPESRPGLRSGHMPGALNLHYAQVLDADSKTLLSPDVLKQRFLDSGLDLQKPVITTCGSGISACLLSLALAHATGKEAAVYDGSWAEWGREPELPVE